MAPRDPGSDGPPAVRGPESGYRGFTTARRTARAMTAHPALEKMTLDAFHATPLNSLQRAHEIETVGFTGFHTNWCVESSARSDYDLG
jgi:nicotinamidase-related amidase